MPQQPMTPEAQAAYNKALKRIEACRLMGKKRGSLDLTGLQLTALPPQIGQLTSLTSLSLSGNQLISLPPEIGQLTSLTALDLTENRLISLPPEIGQLTSLTELYLTENQLISLPPQIGHLTTLTALDLYGNQLTSLPAQIGELTLLTQLYLGSNQLNSLPAEIGQLTALTALHLSDNQLTSLPAEISQLTLLTQLYLGSNQFTRLPPEIGRLTSLTELYLSGNRLTSLPAEIVQLTSLTVLYLWNNRLTRLPDEIVQLTSLTELDLSNNQLSSLPAEIGQLTSLTSLYLSGNEVSSLPAEIGQLTSLTSLYLSGNEVSSLPAEIGQLTLLTELDLSNNQLSSLPAEIGLLSNLERLILEQNDLRDLPLSLLDLKNLQELTLHDNILLELSIEMLGPHYGDSDKEKNPPARPQEILAFYFAQKRGARRPLNEVKVLVVGESEVGKTSLIRQLRGENHNPKEDKTHGIERHRVPMQCSGLGAVRLNVWDFGGQDIMHATHQFFLTHRSLYILVLDSRQNERQTRMDYWLKLIASYGGDSPVIIVCNKADQEVMQLNWTGLQRDYPQIKGFAREVCCYHFEGTDRRKGLVELSQLIAQTVEDHVAEVDRPILTSWLDLKDELETDGRPYLTLDQYHLLAEKRGITIRQDREILLSLMHQLGSVLHFSEHAIFEKDKALDATPAHVEELNVLDPGWVTGAIYKLLNDADLIRAGGRMDRGSMASSLAKLKGHEYPGSRKDFIIAMMRRFEICFAFDGERDQWFLPDLLHKDEVDTGNWQGATTFRYKYEVLPGSIISRLMVRLHHHIAKHCLWRTGAKFNQGPCEALVRSDMENARIDLYVRGGSKGQRQAFLMLIRGTLEDIHRSFSGHLGVEEQLPLPAHPEVYVDYEKYLLMEEDGTLLDHVKVNGKVEEIEVTAVLNQASQRPQRNSERERRKPKDESRLGQLKRGRSIQFHTSVHLGDVINNNDQSTMKTIHDDHSTGKTSITDSFKGNVNSQVGQTLSQCTLMVQQQTAGEVKSLLESLTKDVKTLIEKLPEDKQEEAATNLELLTKAVTIAKPNRAWYSVSAEGLIEASKFVKDFTGNIAGTVGQLRKLVFPD